jgi:hypothetical protein
MRNAECGVGNALSSGAWKWGRGSGILGAREPCGRRTAFVSTRG